MAEENYDPSKDPARKAKSKDPAWEYGFWPNLEEKDKVECSLCHKQMHSGIKRLKQHLTGGYGDVGKCLNASEEIRRKIHDYVQGKIKAKNKGQIQFNDNEEADEDNEELASTGNKQPSSQDSIFVPSSGTAYKRKQSTIKFVEQRVGKQSKSVANMLRKTPEMVVEERHTKGAAQTTMEDCTRTNEEKERIHIHIAKFFYECGIPFNAANSRSFEIMVESIGQGGPGLKPPTYHDLRGPLLQKVVKETPIERKPYSFMEATWMLTHVGRMDRSKGYVLKEVSEGLYTWRTCFGLQLSAATA